MTREQEIAELNAFLDVNFGPSGADTRTVIERMARDLRNEFSVLAASCLPTDGLTQRAQESIANYERVPRYTSLRRICVGVAAVKLRIERLEATEQ